MDDKKFTCKGKEWYLLSKFIVIEEGTGPLHEKTKSDTVKNLKKLEFVLILFSLFIFGLVIWGILQIIPASPFKSNMNLVFGLLSFGLFSGSVFMWLWHILKARRIINSTYVPPNGEEELTLYETTQNGIYINLYNRAQREEMIFLDWKDVKNMSVDNMRYLHYYLKPTESNRKHQEKMLKKTFNAIKDRLDNFSYEPKFIYEDIQAIYFVSSNGQYLNQLPIPPYWYEDGKYEQFITELKRHVEFSDESVISGFIDVEVS